MNRTKLVLTLHYLTAFCAILFILVYLFASVQRLGYPYELQWMEGGMVDHVRRVMGGEPLYVTPTIDFVPYIYPPFYYYAAVLLSEILGVGFLPLRLISLLASLGAFGLVGLIVWKETGSGFPAALAAGFLAATFKISGAWMDTGRIDSLFVFLTLLAAYQVRFAPSPAATITAGLFMALAMLTKQTALAAAGALGLYLLLTDWRRFLAFAVPVVGIVGTFTAYMEAQSGGWYRYYVFDLPGQHAWDKSKLLDFWLVDLAPVAVAGVFGMVYLARMGVRSWQEFTGRMTRRGMVRHASTQDMTAFLFYALLSGAMIISAWAGRLHTGGYVNVLIPALAVIAVLFGLGVNTMLNGRLHRVAPTELPSLARTPRCVRPKALVLILCSLQFALLIYNPGDYIPTARDRAAGDYLIERIRQIEGEVLVFHHGYLAALAGKATIYASRMAVEDVMRGTDETVKAGLQASITQALEQKRFAAILFDGSRENFILVDYYFPALDANYVGQGTIFPAEYDGAFWPLGGLQVRPYYVFVPR